MQLLPLSRVLISMKAQTWPLTASFRPSLSVCLCREAATAKLSCSSPVHVPV